MRYEPGCYIAELAAGIDAALTEGTKKAFIEEAKEGLSEEGI